MNQGLTQWGGLSLVLGWGAILGLGLSIAKAIAENIRGT